jgi:tryptophan synthase alpha chain
MTTIEKCIRKLRENGEGAIIAYVCGGDPTPKHTYNIVDSLIRGGADIIELGIPFSDPIADGPTIQAASTRALKAGTTPAKVMEIAQEVKRNNPSHPLVILTYFNPIFRIGLERFFKVANENLIDGVIIPDLPVEESRDYKRVADDCGIATIFMATPNTSKTRLEKIITYTSGFLYLVSVFGVTGARERVHELTIKTLKQITPQINGRIPLAVGFGISKPDHVKTIIKNGADGAIIGSAFVRIIEKYQNNTEKMLEKIEEKTSQLKSGTR